MEYEKIKHKVIDNVRVYDLENSVKESKYPMQVDVSKCNSEVTDRTVKLAMAPRGSGHDNFLKGIIVRLDLTLTVKAWIEAERYHWLDITSMQSTMHRIAQMDYTRCFCGYVTNSMHNEMERLREAYNASQSHEDYLVLLYNCPVGMILTAGISTNYLQLKTIYAQRKNHLLPEWRIVCDWIETLPHSEFITGKVEK